jgi:hypothetical protein
MSNPSSDAISLTDMPHIIGLLRAIFRPVEARCNEIRLSAGHGSGQIVGLIASKHRNALPSLYQGTFSAR